MFHRHKWKVVSKEQQPSTLDVLLKAGATHIEQGNNWNFDKRDVIVHYRCDCGEERVKRV